MVAVAAKTVPVRMVREPTTAAPNARFLRRAVRAVKVREKVARSIRRAMALDKATDKVAVPNRAATNP